MNILITADNNFRKPLATLLWSISKNSDSNEMNTFYYPYLKKDQKSKIDEYFLKKYLRAIDKLCLIEIPLNLPNSFYSGRWSYQIWLKLVSIFYLPVELDRILYIDSDCVVDDSLSDLYSSPLSLSVLGINHDPKDNYDNLKRLGIKYDGNYFNGGILLINPKKFVTDFKDVSSLFERFEALPFVPKYQEQDLLNYTYHFKEAIINDKRFCFFPWYCYDKHKKPVIIHFAGADKPWDKYDYDYKIRIFFIFWKYAIRAFGFGRLFWILIKSIKYFLIKCYHHFSRK